MTTSTEMDSALVSASDALDERVGLRTTSATRARLESCLLHRADALGMPLRRYADRLRSDADEIQRLIDGLTVQETSFFRDAAHLEALTHHVLRFERGPVVVWSAGCASGQEPYSIAMALDEVGIRDFHVVATDVSRTAIERTRQAAYRESELRGLSAARRGRYLVRDGATWRIDPTLRDRVTAKHHNLVTQSPAVGRGDAAAVFCRNVFLYLCRDRIDAFLRRLPDHLIPRGVLFLGGSESLWTVPAGWTLEHIGDAFAYRVADAGPATARPRPAARPAATQAPAVAPVPPSPPRPVRRPELSGELGHPGSDEVAAHRRAVYLAPEDALAHLQLGLSLEAVGDVRAGRRAFRAARAALDRTDREELEARLEGYDVDALRSMIDAKLSEEGPCR